MLNSDVVKLYLESGRKRCKLFEFVAGNSGCSVESCQRKCDSWLKRFNYRWSTTRCKSRFYADHKVWLDSPFELPDSPVASSSSLSSPPSQERSPHKRGRRTRLFQTLSNRVKSRQSNCLAKSEPLEKLLRAAQKVARKESNPNVVKLLRKLVIGGEQWASEILQLSEESQNHRESTLMESLEVKTRLRLTKSVFDGIRSFSKKKHGSSLFQPWKKVMEYRDSIIPQIILPSWENGILTIKVTLRDMTLCNVARILELDHVSAKLSTIAEPGHADPVECVLYISGGLDSATCFPHYNQAHILRKDDSLLTENVLPLMLESKCGKKLWINPNPQSDTFCRAKIMTWAKETAELTRKMFEAFYEEVNDILNTPINVEVNGFRVRVTVSAIYAMIDGKAANAIVGNKNTHACPLCVKGADPRIGPGYFHCRLNTVEWLIRVSAQKQVNGHPAQSHPLVIKKQRQICDRLEEAFKVSVNRPKIGGSGSSNTGNMARRLLANPKQFAEILCVSEGLVERIRLLSCLALSSNALDSTKVKQLYNETEALLYKEFDFITRLPPSVHKFSHLPEYIEKLPYTLNFIDEQAGERGHKRYKHARSHLARKISPEANITDMLKLSLTWSDPKMSDNAYRVKKSPCSEVSKNLFTKAMTEYYKCVGADMTDICETEDFFEDTDNEISSDDSGNEYEED